VLCYMKILFVNLLLALFFACFVEADVSQLQQADIPLVINELMAVNSSVITDPQGQYDDWIELYNYGSYTISVGGMYLTDNLSDPTKWQIPASTNIPAGGYLLIWADGNTGDSGLHADFKLEAEGEEIGLFDADGETLVDSVFFPEQTNDISYGRDPNVFDNWRFMSTPTPGDYNSDAYLGEVVAPEISHKHGFYETPFILTIATETEGADIYYSTNGSEPYLIGSRGSVTGTIYTGPFQINGTACLRAQAVKAGWKNSKIVTCTYFFLDDVITQSPNGQRPGDGWPSQGSSVNGQRIDYGMDPDIVNDPRYASLIVDSLRAVPAISLVTRLSNLFGSSDGIYVNAGNDGLNWERPVSVELIYPDGRDGFQIDAGLRIRGGFSRTDSNPKHAFRLFFRDEYGDAKLRYPLFDNEGVGEFDNVDLRTSQNYSWSFQGDSRNTMVREVFSRDLQGQMGHPYTRSRYYHLYINGHYWGLFQTQERSEASYAESYFGGQKEDYDVVKSDQGYSMAATDGNRDAYRRLYNAAIAGFRDNAAYYKVQGRNPDGTLNPDYEKLLDVDNLIDFMIIEYYTGDRDGPGSRFVNRPNNTYCIYNRNRPDGWKFFQHDSEHSLGIPGDSDNMVTPFTSAGAQWSYFNPHWLHEQLISQNADYRQRFADRVQKHLFNSGLLTPDVSIARIEARAAQIELAIIAESARWGDSSHNPAYTRDNWFIAVEDVRNWIEYRNPVLLSQFLSQNWFPDIDAPDFNRQGGPVSDGFNLSISSQRGDIYYSLDSSDPRPSGIMQLVEPLINILVTEDAYKRVLVPNESISDAWKGSRFFNDRGWIQGEGGVGYDTGTDYLPYINVDLYGRMYQGRTGCYIRIRFDAAQDLSQFDSMTLRMRYDDGFVAYINGVEVARSNAPQSPQWDSAATTQNSDSSAVNFQDFDISSYLYLLNAGENILAIHGLNISPTSSDFLISSELVTGHSYPAGDPGISPNAIQYTGPIALTESAHVKARALDGGTWSALNEVTFSVGPVAQNLRITELMYHPDNDPNDEYVELTNTGNETINLNLVKFTNGIDFTFGDIDLAPGEYVVVVQDQAAFNVRYGIGINIAGQYSGRLNNAGEKVRLEDAVGQAILEFSYRDGWRSITDGDDFSLTIINPANPDPNSWGQKDSWRPSAYTGGTPGWDDSGIVPDPGSVVINEILAHSHENSPDWIELYNTTSAAIDIGGWYISDSNTNLKKYKIASGTTIASYGYMVFYEDTNFNNPADPGSLTGFALSENGESLYLSSTQNNILTGYRQVEDFGASATAVSFGRYFKVSTGNYNFVALSETTEGSANAYPKVGPLVISEIMYNPAWPVGGSFTDEQYEYIKLTNISSGPVVLYDDMTSLSWKLTGGIEFTFPQDLPVVIGAGASLFVVKHPGAFSWRYPDVPSGQIYGPYEGSLSNAGESFELSMPGEVDGLGGGYYIRIDRVNYSDGSHPEDNPGGADLWPNQADGKGYSLARKELSDYGNDPDNWFAAIPSPIH